MLPDDAPAVFRGLVGAVPEPYAFHVVRRSCGYAEIGPWASLFHSLHFQGQDLFVVHNSWHAVGNHSEVFPAGKHARAGEQFREFQHGVVRPEGVMPMEEKVGMQGAETLLLPAFQFRSVGRNEGLEHPGAADIFGKQTLQRKPE